MVYIYAQVSKLFLIGMSINEVALDCDGATLNDLGNQSYRNGDPFHAVHDP